MSEGVRLVLDLLNSPVLQVEPVFEPAGTKHKTMLEARTGVGSIKSFPRPGVKSKLAASTKSTGLQNKTFYCEICDVHVNSDTQLKQVGQKPFKTFQTITPGRAFKIRHWRRNMAEMAGFPPVRSFTKPSGTDSYPRKQKRFKANKASPNPSQKSGLLL